MELINPPQSYHVDQAPESPYLKAQQQWDERIGNAVAQAKNWRIAFILSSLLTTALVATNAYQLTLATVVPVVITVNADTGAPAVIGKVTNSNYKPRENEIRYFLTQFIRYVRTVPVDPVVVKANWLMAYKFLRPEAANALNTITNEEDDNPLKKIGAETVAIQPLTVLYVAGSKSYQVRWTETIFTSNGELKSTYTMSGLFTVELEEPTTEEQIMVNPLGLFIKSFQWNRELEGGSK